MSSMGFLVQGAKVGSDRGDRYAQMEGFMPRTSSSATAFAAGLTISAAGEERQFLQRRFPQITIQGSHQHRSQDLDINPVRITRPTAACESQFPLPERRMWPP